MDVDVILSSPSYDPINQTPRKCRGSFRDIALERHLAILACMFVFCTEINFQTFCSDRSMLILVDRAEQKDRA